MPANLIPQYHKAEAAYRRAQSPEEVLRGLELMLREVPKHKGTDKLQGELKAKISKAKQAVELARKVGKKGPPGVKFPRQGAGRAVILGGPNAGKSQLLAKLTRATPQVAPHPFTTREPQPGMMPWEDVLVQLIDTPPIAADVFDSSIQGLIRGSDLALLVVDVGSDEGIEALQPVFDRLSQTKTRLARESYLSDEDVGLSFTQTLLVLNKIDLPGLEERLTLLKEISPADFAEHRISAEHGTGLDDLRRAIFAALDVVRVYTKLPTEKAADYDRPFTLKRGGTLLDVAELVHRDLAASFKYARVWGSGVLDPAAQMKGDYVVHDKDVVEIHV
ncbi:MAG: GTPase [Pirellulaceae bacterium]